MYSRNIEYNIITKKICIYKISNEFWNVKNMK